MYKDCFFNDDNLPDQLTKEETIRLLIEAKKGSTEAKNKIVESNIRLIKYIISKKFFNTKYDINELISVGSIGIINAVNTFDLKKNYEFSTYASKSIINEILNFLKKDNKDKDIISIESEIFYSKNGDKSLKIIDIISDDYDFTDNIDNKEILNIIYKIIYQLSGKERKIIMMYFGFYNKVYTQNEIAKSLNISRSYVSKIIKDSIVKIQLQLKKFNIIEFENKDTNEKSNKKVNNYTLYDMFNKNSKSKVDFAISKLSNEDKKILFTIYNENLEDINGSNVPEEIRYIFFKRVYPQLKEMLTNPYYLNIIKKNNNFKVKNLDDTDIITQKISKYDLVSMHNLFKLPFFNKIVEKYSSKEVLFVLLKFGFAEKHYSTDEIAKKFGIEKREVIVVIRKILVEYKDIINNYFDNYIDLYVDEENNKSLNY